MPEITIVITVPEGTTVYVPPTAVSVATVAAPRAVTSAVCPEHNLAWKHVPAGISKKTGQPYKDFWACPEMGCRHKPAPGWKPPITEAVGPPDDSYDWGMDEPA